MCSVEVHSNIVHMVRVYGKIVCCLEAQGIDVC